ncbi:MAG: nucleotidyltransferase family protein [Lunatimonas sp.]|uniref:nucleotidyltransferase family protein n=1 Tax=Lunatimonas sp. TaxID=2060141 RepID=UPI00263B727D|nr:nucleotidyltransferase family protein [Lunatimonas sp.]MCC5939588.1 nucleotidyltransferase family protein [Lunatimonas sp.]
MGVGITNPTTGLIILAAGNSSRLGRPKQLITAGRTHLMGHVLEEAEKVTFHKKVLVLGAYSDDLINEIYSTSFEVVINEKWQQGMSSSIHAGLAHLLADSSIDQVMILLCDQPFLDSDVLLRLLDRSEESEKGIIASSYGESLGVPVIFKKPYFPYLLEMKGQGGAKQLVRQFKDDVDTVPFPNGHIDIDTEEDYDAFLKNDFAYFSNKK